MSFEGSVAINIYVGLSEDKIQLCMALLHCPSTINVCNEFCNTWPVFISSVCTCI